MGNCFLFTMVFITLDVINLIIITFVNYALPTNVVDSHIENRYDINMSVFEIIVDFLH